MLLRSLLLLILPSLLAAKSPGSLKTVTTKPLVNLTQPVTAKIPLFRTSIDSAPPPSPDDNFDPDYIRKVAQTGFLNFTLKFEKVVADLIPCFDKNVLFAPVNVVGTLATLLLGSDGETRNEILNVLGLAVGKNLTNKEYKVHAVLGVLLNEFSLERTVNPAVSASFAKAIFIQNGTEIGKDFKEYSESIYRNEIKPIDFIGDGNKAADSINEWVSNKTTNRIPTIVDPPISPTTRLILANTLLFNGEWDEPFLENSTWQPFISEGGIIKVKTMERQGSLLMHVDDARKFNAYGLPYKGNAVFMYIILPFAGQSLRSVISDLTADDLSAIPDKMTLQEDIEFKMPFMNIVGDVDLKATLFTLGIRTAFDEGSANFSKIAKDVFVSDAIHKVNLDVTEAGSTGAAATSFTIQSRIPKVQIINRPFLFYILHKSSGIITFWGTIQKPIPFKVEI